MVMVLVIKDNKTSRDFEHTSAVYIVYTLVFIQYYMQVALLTLV